MDEKRIMFLLALIAVVLGSLGCGGAETSQLGDGADTAEQGAVYFNLVILLDLSDRIKEPDQVEKDSVIIEHICSIFDSEVRKKLYLRSQERIQIQIAPQPGSDIPFTQSQHSQIDVGKIPLTERRDSLPGLEQRFIAYSESLYCNASAKETYVGADIWGFFKDEIDDCIIVRTDKRDFRNILIILTDGYLQFNKDVLGSRLCEGNRCPYMKVKRFLGNPNWRREFDKGNYGLIPIKNRDFGNLEVLVLEVRPNQILDTSEWDIIQRYWYQWFEEMGIASSSVRKTQDSPPDTKSIIDQFIYNPK